MWVTAGCGRVVRVGLLAALTAAGCGRLRFEARTEPTHDAAIDARVDSSVDGSVDADTDARISSDARIEAGPLLDANTDASASTDAANDATGDANRDAAADAQVTPCTWTAFGAPEEILGLNVTGELWGPALSADGLTLYFALVAGGDERILVATRPDRGPVFSSASEPANINSTGEDGTPFLSGDGLTLYFFSTRAGGMGDRDLWYATRANDAATFNAALLVPDVNSTAFDQLPRLSSDGLTLSFSSGRTGSSGICDFWFATRASTTVAFDTPTNTSELNSASFDAAASISNDGLLAVFASDRPGGMGRLDLWTATRTNTSEPFGSFQTLGQANTSTNDADPVLSADDRELFYSSDRDGTRKLWRVTRDCL
jgi:Tol biopolymer transport system component